MTRKCQSTGVPQCPGSIGRHSGTPALGHFRMRLPGLDRLCLAVNRCDPAPDRITFHPLDWAELRAIRDADGRPALLADALWGIPVATADDAPRFAARVGPFEVDLV